MDEKDIALRISKLRTQKNVSAREMSWMQAEYDVVGNLYWAVNRYAMGAGNEPLEDYYADAMRYPQCNGDGYLFYPGGQYGLSDPVASLRLEAIRDGLEEYEIALDCEEKTEEIEQKAGIELDWKGLFNILTKDLYDGTIVISNCETFDNTRRQFYNLAQMVLSDADLGLVSYVDDGYGEIEYKFYLASGYKLTLNGTEITSAIPQGEGFIYTVTVSKNELDAAVFGVKGADVDLTFTENLKGSVELYTAEKFENSFTAGTASVIATAPFFIR